MVSNEKRNEENDISKTMTGTNYVDASCKHICSSQIFVA